MQLSYFWFAYLCFFIYIFPLFFVMLIGGGSSSPLVAQMALGIGIVAWLLYLGYIAKKFIFAPLTAIKQSQSVRQHGKQVKAEVLSKILLQEKSDYQLIKILVSFPNFQGTDVTTYVELKDTQPTMRRFDKGRVIDVFLNSQGGHPLLIVEGAETSTHSLMFGVLFWLFTLCYALVTFAYWTSMLSGQFSIQYLSLLHPWILIPLGALFIFNVMGFASRMGRSQSIDQLILYGKKTSATLEDYHQTGTFINEQPQISFTISFEDDKLQQISTTYKQIVLLTDLHKLQRGEVEILYLPDNPTVVKVLDF
ncbi:hypothetical protein [Pelistega sp. MC2]|uniref:hypothetical protein n=1 Tax=Pelistega sp. MC2 TaxID=1720297 RepID=UPI0008DAF591|nr:hypothetical protein [Pelistega sp. MC2]